jgi:glycerol-3-phosphate dehydrogenase
MIYLIKCSKRNKWLNIYMKRYKATVNAAGLWVETILYAQNQAQAYKLFQAIFGANNVPHQPLQIG